MLKKFGQSCDAETECCCGIRKHHVNDCGDIALPSKSVVKQKRVHMLTRGWGYADECSRPLPYLILYYQLISPPAKVLHTLSLAAGKKKMPKVLS